MNSRSAMIAADRPKTPRRALKKTKPSSVARITPIERLAENGASLICASPKRLGRPKQHLALMVAQNGNRPKRHDAIVRSQAAVPPGGLCPQCISSAMYFLALVC